MRRQWNAALMLLVPVVFAACASSAGPSTGDVAATVDEDRVILRITNNHTANTAATIFVEPQAGVRRQVGQVQPGSTADIPYQFPNVGNYTMEAQFLDGSSRRSPQFRISGGELVLWDLASNRVTPRRR